MYIHVHSYNANVLLLPPLPSPVHCFSPLLKFSSHKITPSSAEATLKQLQTSPSSALILLSHLSSLPPLSLTPYYHAIASTLPLLLSPSVARRVQELYLHLWTKLNVVVPRRSEFIRQKMYVHVRIYMYMLLIFSSNLCKWAHWSL